MCNYCQESGHWKVNRPILLARDRSGEGRGGKQGNPIALAASLPVPLGLDRGYGEYKECDMFDGPRKSLMPVWGGFVTLPGGHT